MIEQIFRKASAWFLWLSVIVLVLLVYYSNVIFQEGNPLPILRAAIRLEATQAEIVSVTPDQKILLQKAGAAEPLHEYMEERGWFFKERMGSGIFYENSKGTTFLVVSRMFSRRYMVYELETMP